MWPLIKKERKDFNAVIEGTYHDDWSNLNYKIIQLDIPENIAILCDGTYKYKLYGRTQDFADVTKVNGAAGDLETKIDFLGFCEGVVFPYGRGIPNILERPRTVCMRDGRIFIDDQMITDQTYLDTVLAVVKTAGKIFSDKRFSELYEEVTK